MNTAKPTIEAPAFKQYKSGFFREWYEGQDLKIRKRKKISEEEYTKMTSPKKAPKRAVIPKEKRCASRQHDFSEPDEDGWQTCSKCGGKRKKRNTANAKKGQAIYTYKW